MTNTIQAKPITVTELQQFHLLSWKRQKEIAQHLPMFYTRNCYDMPRPSEEAISGIKTSWSGTGSGLAGTN